MLQIYIGGCLIGCNGCYFHGNMLTGIPVQYCYIVTKNSIQNICYRSQKYFSRKPTNLLCWSASCKCRDWSHSVPPHPPSYFCIFIWTTSYLSQPSQRWLCKSFELCVKFSTEYMKESDLSVYLYRVCNLTHFVVFHSPCNFTQCVI